MEKNRINFAKYQIFRYAEKLFICLSELMNPDIEQSMNMRPHGLSKPELIILLSELFSAHMLVALKDERGLFTPTLEEIESALMESNDYLHRSSNTFYGITTAAMEPLQQLSALYGNET